MASKGLRRLASDHASLHKLGLPPNYLFPSTDDALANLTVLRVLLAGPEGTPFHSGVFSMDLNIPPTYPQQPPTAKFRTKIFHPNVDPATGAICVDTLKRDWKPELTLRDILVTITCLLVFPNPASALNAEAGRLCEEEFEEYERKARLWARMHAQIPEDMRASVEDARSRGEKDGAGGPSDAARKLAKSRTTTKKAVEIPVSDDVFVREDSTQRTPPRPLAATGSMQAPPLPTPKGLGIDFPGSSLNTKIESSPDTPTQPAAPTRRRKNIAGPDELPPPPAAPSFSFATTVPTPTPANNPLARPLIHSNPSTPRLGRPDAKRRRVTPPEEPPALEASLGHDVGESAALHASQSQLRSRPILPALTAPTSKAPSIDADQRETELAPSEMQIEPPTAAAHSAMSHNPSWWHWNAHSPASSPEDAVTRQRRLDGEVRRLESVGGCLRKYNAGLFGPRVGIGRL